MKLKNLWMALMLGIMFSVFAMPGYAIYLNEPTMVTNYSVGGFNYLKGASTVTVTVTSDANKSDIGNVTIYWTLDMAFHNMTNATVANGTNVTWTYLYTVPSGSNTSVSWFYVNATNGTAGGASLLKNVSYKWDGANPAVTSEAPTGANRSRTGDVSFTASITDNVAIKNATIDFTSVPTGSSVTDGTMDCSGATSCTANRTITVDAYGDYTYRIIVYDNVTNTVTGTSYTYWHRKPPSYEIDEEEITPVLVVTEPGMPPLEVLPPKEPSPGLFEDPVGYFVSGFRGLFDLLFGWLPF